MRRSARDYFGPVDVQIDIVNGNDVSMNRRVVSVIGGDVKPYNSNTSLYGYNVYAETPDFDWRDSTGQKATWILWFLPTWRKGAYHHIFSQYSETESAENMRCFDISGTNTGLIIMELRTSLTKEGLVSKTGQWGVMPPNGESIHFMAAVFDGTLSGSLDSDVTVNARMKFFVNGQRVLVNKATLSGYDPYIRNSTSKIALGCNYASGVAKEKVGAVVAEAAIINRALTEQEIKNYYSWAMRRPMMLNAYAPMLFS